MNFPQHGYGRKFWGSQLQAVGARHAGRHHRRRELAHRPGHRRPDRIAIYGGSYGGYATLAGITFTPELYACAVDYVGVSNLFTFMRTILPTGSPTWT